MCNDEVVQLGTSAYLKLCLATKELSVVAGIFLGPTSPG